MGRAEQRCYRKLISEMGTLQEVLNHIRYQRTLCEHGNSPGNAEDDAEGRNIGSKQSSCQLDSYQHRPSVNVSLPGVGLEDSSSTLKVWGSKLLSIEGKGITPVEIDTALSSCPDIVDMSSPLSSPVIYASARGVASSSPGLYTSPV